MEKSSIQMKYNLLYMTGCIRSDQRKVQRTIGLVMERGIYHPSFANRRIDLGQCPSHDPPTLKMKFLSIENRPSQPDAL